MYPHAGGDYVTWRSLHPFAGFVIGWLSFFVIYAGTVATLAAGSPKAGAFCRARRRRQDRGGDCHHRATSWINYAGVRAGAASTTSPATSRSRRSWASPSSAIARPRQRAHFRPLLVGAAAVPLEGFGLALSPILFSYLGWNASVYVASEFATPGATCRARSSWSGDLHVIYLLINAVYLYALPIAELRGEVRVGEAVARALFGEMGGTLTRCWCWRRW